MYLIEKNNVLKIAENLAANYALYGPMVDPDTQQVFFDSIADIKQLDLQAAIPSLPVKNSVFPQMETILRYQYDRKKKNALVSAMVKETPKALFGVRPCDLAGLQCLDRFFLGQEFVDDIFLTHRRQTFIVSNTCVTPFKQCFCVCTHSGPAAAEGYDLNLTAIENFYLVETGSEKGEQLVKSLKLKKATARQEKEKIEVIERSIGLFNPVATENKAWISRVMNRVTTGFIKPEIWEFIGNQCFECGACSFICPTCSCFNIEDVVSEGGKANADRLRTWDSCSFEGYTRMAGDHNPRKPVEDRRNKRFFCKLSFSQAKKYLRPGCVGCGRCAWVCPGDIGLPNVVQYLRRETTQPG